MVQTELFVRPLVLIVFASQPYCRLSPSSRSETKIRSFDWRLWTRSMEQEEKSVWVKQLFLITCRVPRTALSDILNIDSDSKSTSGFKSLPVHSTSCRLCNPLKSRTKSPEINTDNLLHFTVVIIPIFCINPLFRNRKRRVYIGAYSK